MYPPTAAEEHSKSISETTGNWRRHHSRRAREEVDAQETKPTLYKYYPRKPEVADNRSRNLPDYVRTSVIKKTYTDPELYYLYSRLEHNRSMIQDRIQDLSGRSGVGRRG
jgi:hypothetical protein